jgi:hypothetical protein
MKIRPVGAELSMRTEGRMGRGTEGLEDIHNEASSRFFAILRTPLKIGASDNTNVFIHT